MPGERRTRDKRLDESYHDEAYDNEEYDEGDEAYYDEPRDERRRARAPAKDRGEELRPQEALPPDAIARLALRYIAELTARQPLGVTALERAEDGWVVEVEVVEDSRIPSTADVLGLYRAEIGTDGSVGAFRRIRRYLRGQRDSSEVV